MALPVAWLDHDWFFFVIRISTVTLCKGDISNLRVEIQKGLFFLNINYCLLPLVLSMGIAEKSLALSSLFPLSVSH